MRSITEKEYQELLKQSQELKKMNSLVQQLTQDKGTLIAEVDKLQNQLEWFRKQIFGKKSEKNLPLDSINLIPSLFDESLSAEEQAEISAAVVELNKEIEKDIVVPEHTRKRRDKNRTLDISKLEIEEDEILPKGLDLTQYKKVGEEITDKIIYVPSRLYIKRTIRPRFVLKSNLQILNPEQKAFEIAPLPESPLPKCIASASLLTEILIQKFLYHMPFYRVINKFKLLGFIVSDSTIGDWYAAICTKIKPIYDILKE